MDSPVRFCPQAILAFFALTGLYLPVRAHVLHGLSHSVTPVTWGSMVLTEPSSHLALLPPLAISRRHQWALRSALH